MAIHMHNDNDPMNHPSVLSLIVSHGFHYALYYIIYDIIIFTIIIKIVIIQLFNAPTA